MIDCRSSGEEDSEEGEGEVESPVEDLVPRRSIAAQITDELLDMMKDKNWKVGSLFVCSFTLCFDRLFVRSFLNLFVL